MVGIAPEIAAEAFLFLDLSSRECLRHVSRLFNSVFITYFKCFSSIQGTSLSIKLAETITFHMHFEKRTLLPHYLQRYYVGPDQLRFALLRSEENIERLMHPLGPHVPADSVHRALGRLIGSGMLSFITVEAISVMEASGSERHSFVSLLLHCHQLWTSASSVDLNCLYSNAFGTERDMAGFSQLLSTFPPDSSIVVGQETPALPLPYHFDNLLDYLQMGGSRLGNYRFQMMFHVDAHFRPMLLAGMEECRKKIAQVGGTGIPTAIQFTVAPIFSCFSR